MDSFHKQTWKQCSLFAPLTMPRSSASHCQQILANPDIDGLGVRVALYVQYLIAHLIFLISPEDAFAAWKAIVATTVILVVTTSLYTPYLTLYHALFMTWLTFPALPFTRLYEAFAGYDGFDGSLRFIGGNLFQAIYAAFSLWVWITAPHFGSSGECNDTVIFAFLGRLYITDNIRYLFIAILSLMESMALSLIIRLAFKVANLVASQVAIASKSCVGVLTSTLTSAAATVDSYLAFGFSSAWVILPPVPPIVRILRRIIRRIIRSVTVLVPSLLALSVLLLPMLTIFFVFSHGFTHTHTFLLSFFSAAALQFGVATSALVTISNDRFEVPTYFINWAVSGWVYTLAFAITFVTVMGVLAASAVTVTVTAFIVFVVIAIALATFATASPVFRAFGKNLTPPHEGIRRRFREIRTKWDAVWNQPRWGQTQTEILEMWQDATHNHPLDWVTPPGLRGDVHDWSEVWKTMTHGSTLASMVWLLMSILMMELMIHWNNVQNSDHQWTYGQIFAVTMLGMQFLSLFSIIHHKLWTEVADSEV